MPTNIYRLPSNIRLDNSRHVNTKQTMRKPFDDVAKRMVEAVSSQGNCESVEFTGILFQPVPYSLGTPHGMPKEYERFYKDVNHVIINIPPQIMFRARCSKPPRLCAVYKRIGIPEEELQQKDGNNVELSPAMANDRAQELAKDPWKGLGTVIQENFHAKEVDDADLDKYVV